MGPRGRLPRGGRAAISGSGRLPGPRGRILARDGALLACDKEQPAVAVHSRTLQEPPDAGWLRQMARARFDQKATGRMPAASGRPRAADLF